MRNFASHFVHHTTTKCYVELQELRQFYEYYFKESFEEKKQTHWACRLHYFFRFFLLKFQLVANVTIFAPIFRLFFNISIRKEYVQLNDGIDANWLFFITYPKSVGVSECFLKGINSFVILKARCVCCFCHIEFFQSYKFNELLAQ